MPIILDDVLAFRAYYQSINNTVFGSGVEILTLTLPNKSYKRITVVKERAECNKANIFFHSSDL